MTSTPATEPSGDKGRSEALRRRAIRLEYFTVGWNVIEAGVALAAGSAASSTALIGFGLDSMIETLSGLALLWRFKQRSVSQALAESRAIKAVGLTFFALAAYVIFEAAGDLWNHRAPEFSLPGFVLAGVSLLVMPILGAAKRRVAQALGSRALAADAAETMFCASLSATLLLGLGLNGWRGWWWADPVAGLVLSGLMIREGVEALRGESEASDYRS